MNLPLPSSFSEFYPIIVYGLIVVIYTIYAYRKSYHEDDFPSRTLKIVKLMGVVGLLLGIVGALYIKILSFDAIARANNISPTIIADYMVSVYWYLLVGVLIRIYAVIAFTFLDRE